MFLHYRFVSPCSWSRTSGAGPAAPPAPAMTSESPARDSTWISAMCRRTETRLRNKPPLDNWPVEVHWCSPSPSHLAIGGPAYPSLLLAAAMTATEISMLGVAGVVTAGLAVRRRGPVTRPGSAASDSSRPGATRPWHCPAAVHRTRKVREGEGSG